MRIFLVGFMGAGKTTVGRRVASRLAYDFLDLDEQIALRCGLRVWEIFEQFGEARFRALEHECLATTVKLERAVIATGGGTMSFGRNRSLMNRTGGVSIWLDPSLETVEKRLDATGKAARPLFGSTESVRRLYEERRDAYLRADLRVEVGPTETEDEVTERVLLTLREGHCVI